MNSMLHTKEGNIKEETDSITGSHMHHITSKISNNLLSIGTDILKHALGRSLHECSNKLSKITSFSNP